MKHFFKFGILFLLVVTITGCQNKKNYMTEISYNEYRELINNQETFILEIMRTDCSACINFTPKITQVANDYKIEVKYVNTDHLTATEKDKFEKDTGISGTPTVIFYINGKEETVASRISGSVSVDKIISKFKASGFIK